MRIEGKQLIQGIRKAKGVVAENSVIEHLRGFKFNPREDGRLDIAGSDGRLTMLAQIPYEVTDASDGSQLTISSDKLQELIQYIDSTSYVEFEYEEGSDDVVIKVDDYKLKTHKKEFENEFIDFDMIDETEFDDVLDVKELSHILDSLIPLARLDSPDGLHQTIYLNGEDAFLFDGNIVARISFETNAQYVIEQKSAKQIQVLLKNSKSEKAKFKLLNDGHEVLLKTSTDTLTFKVMEPEMGDVSFIDDFEESFSFKVNRLDMVQSIQRTKLATEEDEIYITIDGDNIRLKGLSGSGEQATDMLPIEDIRGEVMETEIDLLAENYINLSKSLRTKEVTLAFDIDNLYLMIKDTENNALALMTVNM